MKVNSTKNLLTVGLIAYFVIVTTGFIYGVFNNDPIFMNRIFILALSVCIVMVYMYLINTHEDRRQPVSGF